MKIKAEVVNDYNKMLRVSIIRRCRSQLKFHSMSETNITFELGQIT